jgi:peptidoglycan endopeptidase LytF
MTTKNSPSSGSSFEQAGRKKTNLPVLVMIFLGLHAVVLGGVLWVGCKPHKPQTEEAPPPPVLPPLGQAPDTNAFFPPLPPSGGGEPTPIAPIPGGVATTPIPPPGGAPAPAPIPVPAPSPEPVMPTPIPAPRPPAGSPDISPPVVGGAPTPAPAPVQGSGGVHIVARGDTYYSIARDHHTTVTALKATNPGVDPRKLQLGQKIKVPAAAPAAAGRPEAHDSSAYVVKSGDYLGKIAKRHNVTVARLREVNGLTSDRIRVGQKLKLPAEARR